MLKKSKKMCPHCAKCKKCTRAAPNAKNTAHAEKSKKCRIFVRRTIAFSPWCTKTSANHMEHYILRILRCIKHDSNASTKKTLREFGIQAFQHATTERCCARVFNARNKEILLNRDVHGNGKCGILISLVGFPWKWESNHVNYNGNRTGMGIAQMGMETLIINVFTFSHNLSSKIFILPH